jgi:hypothetical protein
VKRKITYLLFWLVFSAAIPSYAQTPNATAKLDTNSMLIGDQVNLEFSFSFPAQTIVRWPLIGDTILQSIQVINRTKIDTSVSPDKKTVTLHQKLLITTFDSGFYTIPPLRFFYRQPPDTAVRFVQTETLLLSVHTMAVDTTKVFKPIKGPLKVPLTFREVLPWLILALLGILIIIAVIYYLRKRKKAEPVFQILSKHQLLPYEIALAELEKLRTRKLWQEGRIKEYHSELTDILRRYFESRFGIMALEMTSMEILDTIRSQNAMTIETTGRLSDILTTADLVKFAKMRPLPTENDLCMNNAIAVVNDTAVKKEQSVSND